VSVPDVLVALRAVAGFPILIALAFDARAVAVSIFLLAALSDALDGWLARRQGTTTDHGVLLDPLADKALVLLTLAGLSLAGAAPVPLVVGLAAREILVTGLRLLRHRDGRHLPASPAAKLKTALEMCAVSLLIVAPPPGALGGIGVVLLGAALTIGLLTFPAYLPHRRPRFTT
jgi:CDP-diacylglycerol--glycerol-3-phosphate 3-phosphatidyltransferase